MIHTGPFTLERNDPQDIVFGIVFAQGADRFGSVSALRAADRLAQTAYDNGFELAPPPPAPPACVPGNATLAPGSGNCLEAVSLNGQATLVWGYPSNNANYLGGFEAVDVLLDPDAVDDNTYNFEGFNIYRYPTNGFDEASRELVATFDKVNGVTQVVDLVFDTDLGALNPAVVARGTDSGIQYSFQIQNLTNYNDYFYGVSAYSYNEESTPKVIESSPTQIVVRPAGLVSGDQTQSEYGESVTVTAVTQRGGGVVSATIVDPTNVTGDTYEVRFFRVGDEDHPLTTYNIVNTTTGAILLNGQQYFATTGNALPQGSNVIVIDGLSFTVSGPEPDVARRTNGDPAYVEVQNADGTPVCGPNAASTAGCEAEFNNQGNPVYHSFDSIGYYYFSESGEGSEASTGSVCPE